MYYNMRDHANGAWADCSSLAVAAPSAELCAAVSVSLWMSTFAGTINIKMINHNNNNNNNNHHHYSGRAGRQGAGTSSLLSFFSLLSMRDARRAPSPPSASHSPPACCCGSCPGS